MKKFLMGVLLLLLSLTSLKTTSMSDCEYFVYPLLGINKYQECLQNPSAYSSYFVYHTVTFYDGGTLLASKEVRDRSDVVPPANPVKTGYEFLGWDTSLTNVRSDRLINAEWKQMILLTYLDYNGTVLKQEQLDAGATGTPPTTPVRSGFTFVGWSDSYASVTASKTLIAQYVSDSYTVKFYANDNTVIDTQSVLYLYDAVSPTPPVVEGKVFTGWSASFKDVTSDLNIYAQYDDLYYRITFNYDSTTTEVQAIHGAVPVAPSVTKTGYDFLGWSPELAAATMNQTYTAEYAKHKYQVIFYDHNNEVIETQFVEYQGTATQPAYIEPAGLELQGWSESLSNIQSDLEVYPIIDIPSYTVTYILEDETVIAEETVRYGNSCLEEMPTQTGLTFSHLSDSCSEVTQDMVITAYYDPIQFTVTFYNFSDEIISQQQINYGEDAIAPRATDLPRYVVSGWSASFTNVTMDLELYPSGTIRTYTVVFKDYDGTDLCHLEAEYGEIITCSDPQRDGYLFQGWTDSLVVTEDKTIFPNYVRSTFTVDYFLFSQLLKSETVGYQQSGTPPFVSRTGYDFVRWSIPFTGVTEDLSVYAIMEKKTFDVTFQDFDFTTMKVIEVEYGDSVTPPDVTRVGYQFTGWTGSTENITANVSLIATYEPILYTVSFYYEDTLLKEELVAYQETATPPSIDMPGITVLGWSEGYLAVEGDVKITALTEEDSFTVRFFEEETLLKEEVVPYGKSATSPFTAQWSETFDVITNDLDVYLIDRNYPGDLYEIQDQPMRTITYYDLTGHVIEETDYDGDELLTPPEIPGYIFKEWNIVVLEDENQIAEGVYEVDEDYFNKVTYPKISMIELGDGVLLYLKEGLERFEPLSMQISGIKKSLVEFQVQVDDLSQIDRTVSWLLIDGVSLGDIEYVEFIDHDEEIPVYYDLRIGTEDLIYNIYEPTITLSPWDKFLMWIDRLM